MSVVKRSRVVGVRLRDVVGGQEFRVSNRAARLARCERRITEWDYVMDPFIKSSAYATKMITLTYANADDWRPNDRRDFILRLRAYTKESIAGYAVVAELQDRGAVHYHLMIVVKRGVYIPFMDKEGLWLKGSTSIGSKRSPRYLISYVKKERQKGGEYPKGCRIVEIWVNPAYVGLLERWRLHLAGCPKWVSKLCEFEIMDWPRRAAGGGWFIGVRRHWSPFDVVGFQFADDG